MTGTEAIFVIRRKSALFRAAFAVLLVAGSAAAQVPAPGEEAWTLEIPIDARAQTERCPFEAPASDEDLGPVFEYMKRGPVEAVACVNFLEEHTPGWHGAEGAEVLVAPFVEHLLGDGTARGMQRHTIFVDLLGHLEKIAPDWRWRPEVREKMPDIILASVVEDPFVADVWARTLPEMDGDWQQSDAARLLIPALYRLAVEQAERPPGPRNDRPAALLRELSLWSYARLILSTRVFDSPAKVALWITLILGGIYLLVRRRKARAARASRVERAND